MFPGLRFDRFICRDNEQDYIDATRACQHVAHESFVPGDIHKTKSRAIEIQESKAQIDRYPTALFFFQPVGIGTGKSFD